MTVTDHVAAALVRRHRLQQRRLAVEHADAGRAVDLVAGETHRNRNRAPAHRPDVRHRLRAVEQHRYAVGMRKIDDALDRRDAAQRIRQVGDGDQLGAWPDQLGKGVELELAGVVDRHHAQLCAGLLAHTICHGTMFEWCSIALMRMSSSALRRGRA